jgi:tellurite resistance protein
MNPDFLVDGVLRSVMGGRGRKRSKKALKYLTGGKSSSLLSNPATLLTAVGLAWGVYDTISGKSAAGTGNPGGSQWGGGPQWGGGSPTPGSPGPSPAAPAGAASTPLPPLPHVSGQPADAGSQSVLRLVRLAISAASADGVMNDQERAAVLQHAQSAGVHDLVAQELQHRRPLAEIVAGVTDQAERATLYVLAYTVLRADEQVNGAERIYLAQLAHLLGLDPATTERLEKDTGEGIEALGDQGQLGG